MAVDRVAPGPFTDGDLISATDIEELPKGELGRDTLTSNSAGTTTTENICQVTVTVNDDRAIRITGTVTVRSDLAGGVQAALIEDATQIQRKNNDLLEADTDLSWDLVVTVQPAAGSHTYTLVTGVSGGAGNTVTAIANGATGTHGICGIYVDDMGPAYS